MDPLLPQLQALLPGSPVQRLGLSPNNVVISIVAPSRLGNSPIRRANASKIFSPAN